MYKLSAIYHSGDDVHFDEEYYFRVHVPLAMAKMKEWQLKFIKREIVKNVRDMFDATRNGPRFILSYIVESQQDVEDFLAFFQSDLVQTLQEDVPKYTNCAIEWTVAEVEELLE